MPLLQAIKRSGETLAENGGNARCSTMYDVRCMLGIVGIVLYV